MNPTSFEITSHIRLIMFLVDPAFQKLSCYSALSLISFYYWALLYSILLDWCSMISEVNMIPKKHNVEEAIKKEVVGCMFLVKLKSTAMENVSPRIYPACWKTTALPRVDL